MKKIHVLIILLLAITLPVIHAQQYNQEFLQGKVQKFTKMKSTGIVMLSTGAASAVGGIILLSSADWQKTSDGNGNVNYNSNDNNAIVGVLLTGIGAGLIGGGIAMTIIGSKKSEKYRKQLDELTLVPFLNSNQAGVQVTLRF